VNVNVNSELGQRSETASELGALLRNRTVDLLLTIGTQHHRENAFMQVSGVPVEEIARLAGHANSRTTELVYRHQLRPIMEKGAQALDQLFPRTA